ncbi:MAG: hypothetical protein KDC76_14305 [Bacteroidetes bacterium]|nr:hypothetical protein [Bacteroidota bacterium]
MEKEKHIDLVLGGLIPPAELDRISETEEIDPRSAKRFIKGRKVHDPVAAAFICQALCLEQEAEALGLLDQH